MNKSPLIVNPTFGSSELPVSDKDKPEQIAPLEVKNEDVEQSKKEVGQDIPSGYIAVRLPSNGRVEGIPTVLHFRDYTGNDAIDLNVLDDTERVKVLVNVLNRMCFEKFDISLLPVNDVLYILYMLHFTFIKSTVDKDIYIDDTLPEGNDEGQLDYEDNIERVSVPYSAIHVTYLGKDENDVNLEENVKFPLTLTDNQTKSKIRVKLASLKDTLVAENYCKNFYKDKLMEFSDIRRKITEIQGIRKRAVREEQMNKFLEANEQKVSDYYLFIREYATTVAKFVQALQIISYDGKEIDNDEEKWELYKNSISSDMWNFYNKVIEKYHFGINETVEVFSEKLKKKVSRRIPFQLLDFLSLDREERDDRFSLSFD